MTNCNGDLFFIELLSSFWVCPMKRLVSHFKTTPFLNKRNRRIFHASRTLLLYGLWRACDGDLWTSGLNWFSILLGESSVIRKAVLGLKFWSIFPEVLLRDGPSWGGCNGPLITSFLSKICVQSSKLASINILLFVEEVLKGLNFQILSFSLVTVRWGLIVSLVSEKKTLQEAVYVHHKAFTLKPSLFVRAYLRPNKI